MADKKSTVASCAPGAVPHSRCRSPMDAPETNREDLRERSRTASFRIAASVKPGFAPALVGLVAAKRRRGNGHKSWPRPHKMEGIPCGGRRGPAGNLEFRQLFAVGP